MPVSPLDRDALDVSAFLLERAGPKVRELLSSGVTIGEWLKRLRRNGPLDYYVVAHSPAAPDESVARAVLRWLRDRR